MIKMNVKVIGAKALAKKLKPEAIQKPMLAGFKVLGKVLERFVKEATPVLTGRLRASIVHQISPNPKQLWTKVGTKVTYAPFIEFGHRQEPGRFVPAIGKQLVASQVPAYHMEVHGNFKGMEGGVAKFKAMMSASSRVAGKGMFAYALDRLKTDMRHLIRGLGKDIKARFDK